MSKSKKVKAPAMPAAQSRDEVVALIGRMGAITREITRRETVYGDLAAQAKADHEKSLEPLTQEHAEACAKVQGWCEANRASITNNGKVKFARFSTGLVSWRHRPASVKLRGVEALVKLLRGLPNQPFLRVSYEVDKTAMLADRETAAALPGVNIGSEGEEFAVDPFDPQAKAAA